MQDNLAQSISNLGPVSYIKLSISYMKVSEHFTELFDTLTSDSEDLARKFAPMIPSLHLISLYFSYIFNECGKNLKGWKHFEVTRSVEEETDVNMLSEGMGKAILQAEGLLCNFPFLLRSPVEYNTLTTLILLRLNMIVIPTYNTHSCSDNLSFNRT